MVDSHFITLIVFAAIFGGLLGLLRVRRPPPPKSHADNTTPFSRVATKGRHTTLDRGLG